MFKRLNNFYNNYAWSNISEAFSAKSNNKVIKYNILRYNPYYNDVPYMQLWFCSLLEQGSMMLDNLFLFKKDQDESFAFRRSCREGICGSCAMNINGINTLACTYQLHSNYSSVYYIFPLPHMPIIKDLVVCMKHFYEQYKSIDPFLITNSILSNSQWVDEIIPSKYNNSFDFYISPSTVENAQSHANRLLLDGLYECILCACCSTSCPSYWWNKDKYLGPAILLQSYRWIIDSRDDAIFERLSNLNDLYKLYRCHTILNCTQVCPKHLSPALAISSIKSLSSSVLL